MSQSINMAQTNLWEILAVITKTIPPYTTTNAIFFGIDSFVLVDPGSAESEQQQLLANRIKERIHSGHKFLAICLSHHHGDHTAAASYLSNLFCVPIYAHRNALMHSRFTIDKTLNHQEEITLHGDIKLTALYTPGHADDHLVFFNELHGVLIAGDMITDKGTVLIPSGSGSLSLYLKSLDEISRLPLKTILPAHGVAITDKPIKFLIRAMRHRFERILAVFEVLTEAEKILDATDITMIVYHDNVPDNLMFFAQLSVESSLRWLLDNGLVEFKNYKWKALPTARNLKENLILSALEEIQQRLRNS